MDNFDALPSPESPDLPVLQITSVIRVPQDSRSPVQHILIGAPTAVQIIVHRLHQLGYAKATEWARPLSLEEPLNIVPAPGDVISSLVRYLRIQ